MVNRTAPFQRLRQEKRFPAMMLAAFLLTLSVLGYLKTSTMFRSSDDEGLVLYALMNSLDGHPLYDQILTQYGPAFFLVHHLIIGLFRIPVCHDGMRALTLGFWISGSLFLALCTFRTTRNHILTVVTLVGAFSTSSALTNEPGHPQAMLYLLVSITAWLCTFDLGILGSVALGAVCASVILTKINIGMLLLFSLGWMSVTGSSGIGWSALRLSTGVALSALPFMLMSQRLNVTAVLCYAVISASMILTLQIARPLCLARPRRRFKLLPFLFGLAGATISCTCWTLLNGTSLAGLAYGLVGQHIRFANVFHIDYPGTIQMVIGGAVPSLGVVSWLRYLSPDSRRVREIVLSLAKVAQSAFFLLTLALALQPYIRSFAGIQMGYVAPWLWLAAFPTSRDSTDEVGQSIKYNVLLLTALQFMIAYPVAGSQGALAAVLFIPVACIAFSDVADRICHRFPFAAALRYSGFLMVMLLLALILKVTKDHCVMWRANVSPLVLHGASSLRLQERHLVAYEGIVLNVRQNARYLFTMPGMYSFCSWSGVKSPTLMNQTNWPFVLSKEMQEMLFSHVDSLPLVVTIFNEKRFNFWARSASPDSSIALQALLANFTPIARIQGYQLLVRERERAGFHLVGGWKIGDRRISGREGTRGTSHDCTLLRIQCPCIKARFHAIELADLQAKTAVPSLEFSDGACLQLIGAEGELTSWDAARLRSEGVSLTNAPTVLLLVGASVSDENVTEYALHIRDGDGRLLLRMPLLSDVVTCGAIH